MNQNDPKWDISDVFFRGKQAVELYDANAADLNKRFKPGEIETLRNGLMELEVRQSGQPESLNLQKVATRGKELTAQDLHTLIVDTRAQIKATTNNPEILQAFGVGHRLHVGSLMSLRTGANLIISGFTKYRDWAINEGILEEDIEEIKSNSEKLTETDSSQEKAMFERKIKTIDKSTLHRQLEDIITKISSAGIKEYRMKKPTVVPLFEALIPGSGSTGPDNGNDQPENVPEKVTA
jgi:single-stranded DNA-binding protein